MTLTHRFICLSKNAGCLAISCGRAARDARGAGTTAFWVEGECAGPAEGKKPAAAVAGGVVSSTLGWPISGLGALSTGGRWPTAGSGEGVARPATGVLPVARGGPGGLATGIAPLAGLRPGRGTAGWGAGVGFGAGGDGATGAAAAGAAAAGAGVGLGDGAAAGSRGRATPGSAAGPPSSGCGLPKTAAALT